MLIPSPRHKRKDRELWSEYAEADLLAWPELERSGKIERAMSAIREFQAAHGGRVYCSVSFGKDSVVVADLCMRVDPTIPLCHLAPTNASGDVRLVRNELMRRWPDAVWHDEPVDYGDLHRALVSEGELDRETDRRWYAGIAAMTERYGRPILGIRASESRSRRFRVTRHGESCASTCAPIGRWTTQDVFTYLEGRGLPVHPAYGCLGGGRWSREFVRVAEIGDTRGRGLGRSQWESEYYPDELRMVRGSS